MESTLSNLYETLGRKQEQLEAQDAAYTQIINLLAGVVSGEISADRVKVNLESRTWELAPAESTEVPQ